MATYDNEYPDDAFEDAREAVVNHVVIRQYLPHWVILNRYRGQFRAFMQRFQTYKERRDFIWGELGEVSQAVDRASLELGAVPDESFPVYVRQQFDKARDRIAVDDPEGAITLARTMVESMCKNILESYGEEIPKNDLAKLYKATAKAMNLSPDQHNEQAFKKILSGCISIVDGLATVRNALGDAHGSAKPVSPHVRHARFAVSLAQAREDGST